MKKVGVLALQGAFREQLRVFTNLGHESIEVRHPWQLENIQALVIPGGESTSIGNLLLDYGLLEPIRGLSEAGLPILGTCAGLVLLATEIEGSCQTRLGLLDITVRRNAFGRQVESFETDLEIFCLGEKKFQGVFIRAPYITRVGTGVEVLASYSGRPVLVRQGRILAAVFHPELTPDDRLHRYFLEEVAVGGIV